MFNDPIDIDEESVTVDGPGPFPKVTVDRMEDEIRVSQPESIQIGSDLLPGPRFEMSIEEG